MSVKITNWPGTEITLEQIQRGEIIAIPYAPRAEYAWDTGIAVRKYLEALRDGYLLGVRCPRCDRTVIPPRAFCELCFSSAVEYVPLQDTGTVNTFSLCYVTWDVQWITEPLIPAVIEIDGASEGMGILHLLGEVDPQAVKTGLRVEAVWKTKRSRQGAITDIKYFRPVRGK